MSDRAQEKADEAKRTLEALRLVVNRRTAELLGRTHYMRRLEGLDQIANVIEAAIEEIRESLSEHLLALDAVEVELDRELEDTAVRRPPKE